MSLTLLCVYSPTFAQALKGTGTLMVTVGRHLNTAGERVARNGRQMISAGAQLQAVATLAGKVAE